MNNVLCSQAENPEECFAMRLWLKTKEPLHYNRVMIEATPASPPLNDKKGSLTGIVGSLDSHIGHI